MEHIELRAPRSDDVEAMSLVVAQDTDWWGAPDGDIDDLRHELERVEQAMGSLDTGARVAMADGTLIGVALCIGHGHTSAAVDPGSAAAASAARTALFGWLAGLGGFDGIEIESPAQDAERLGELASIGFVPYRSSFELERSGGATDLGEPVWPDGLVPVPFRLGVLTTRNFTT